MIFTAIVDSLKLKKYYEKRDCLDWQPLTLISKEIFDLIENTKNEKCRLERFAAYTLLYYSVEKIFDYRIRNIKKTESGKPYIDDESLKNKLFISISHSGSISAVTISDEAECGVDVQIMVDEKILQNVEKRFLGSIDLSDVKILPFNDGGDALSSADPSFVKLSANGFYNAKNNYLLYAEPCECGFSFLDFLDNEEKNDLLKKWTISESLLKCSGGGFKDLSNIDEIKSRCDIFYCSFRVDNNACGIAVSAFRPLKSK